VPDPDLSKSVESTMPEDITAMFDVAYKDDPVEGPKWEAYKAAGCPDGAWPYSD